MTEQELNDTGTVLLDADTAHVPEAREDIPPMQRIGMPLHDPDLYAEDTTPTDPTAPIDQREEDDSRKGREGSAPSQSQKETKMGPGRGRQ